MPKVPTLSPNGHKSSFINYNKRILVLGSGVIGLTTALTLQRRGFTVDIWAKDLPPHTTSNKAGAYWFPYNIAPAHRVQNWAKETYFYYRDVLSKEPLAFIQPIPFIDFHNHPITEKQFYEDFIPASRMGEKDEIPASFSHGRVLETFSVDVDACMTYYFQMFIQNGGRVTQKFVKNIEEAFVDYDFVINCTGLGSRELFNDQTVFSARGQTILVRSNGYKAVAAVHDESVTYIIPRNGKIVLGGTFQKGNESLLVSEKDTAEILDRCAALHESFSKDKIEILGEKVGLRPCRPEVRLEAEKFHNGGKLVIHNYGHGGAGWSTCYGCANEVLSILEKHLREKQSKL